MNPLTLSQNQPAQDGKKPSDAHQNRINVLTVHYNTQPFIENLVKLLGKEGTLSFRLVIVDNSSNLDRTGLKPSDNVDIAIVQGEAVQTTVLESHRSALNLGLKQLDFRLPYTLFLDPDVVFTRDTISHCKKSLEANSLSAIGVHKFYQYKTGRDIRYPYIWFTLIRTEYLAGFAFQKVHPELLQFLGKARKDTGDSIYALFRKTKTPFRAITSFPKRQQSDLYPFISIQTDDWIDREIGVIVSHYRGGSNERRSVFHPSSRGNDTHSFIEKSDSFTYSDNFFRENHQ